MLAAKRADSLALRESRTSSTVTIPLINLIRSLAISLPLHINELPKDEATLKAFTDLIAALQLAVGTHTNTPPAPPPAPDVSMDVSEDSAQVPVEAPAPPPDPIPCPNPVPTNRGKQKKTKPLAPGQSPTVTATKCAVTSRLGV